jgi:hypothetical protein
MPRFVHLQTLENSSCHKREGNHHQYNCRPLDNDMLKYRLIQEQMGTGSSVCSSSWGSAPFFHLMFQVMDTIGSRVTLWSQNSSSSSPHVLILLNPPEGEGKVSLSQQPQPPYLMCHHLSFAYKPILNLSPGQRGGGLLV